MLALPEPVDVTQEGGVADELETDHAHEGIVGEGPPPRYPVRFFPPWAGIISES